MKFAKLERLDRASGDSHTLYDYAREVADPTWNWLTLNKHLEQFAS
jgi:hypothetical protein